MTKQIAPTDVMSRVKETLSVLRKVLSQRKLFVHGAAGQDAHWYI